MRATLRLFVLTALTLGVLASPARGEPTRASDRCPAYGAALRDARAALARGDRAHALADLERAKVALQACGRDEARKPAVVAALPVSAA
jgi:hypothetical protein